MISPRIRELLIGQPGHYKRKVERRQEVRQCLIQLSISEESQIGQFYLEYCATGILSNKVVEIIDLCEPSRSIMASTIFGIETFEMSDRFISLTSWEGEGCILFSKDNGCIYDVDVAELRLLEKGMIKPKWNSFNELMEWYLDESLSAYRP